jgi:hypothetical protein
MPSNEHKDTRHLPLLLKRHRVPYYWLIWPEARTLAAHALQDGEWRVLMTLKATDVVAIIAASRMRSHPTASPPAKASASGRVASVPGGRARAGWSSSEIALGDFRERIYRRVGANSFAPTTQQAFCACPVGMPIHGNRLIRLRQRQRQRSCFVINLFLTRDLCGSDRRHPGARRVAGPGPGAQGI